MRAEAWSPTSRPNGWNLPTKILVICFYECTSAHRVASVLHSNHRRLGSSLQEEKYRDVLISSLKFLTENNKIKINAFVIMNNHIHLIWQAIGGYDLKESQTAFKTAERR